MKTAQSGAQSLGIETFIASESPGEASGAMCHKGDCDHLLGYPALKRVVLSHTPQQTSGNIWGQFW